MGYELDENGIPVGTRIAKIAVPDYGDTLIDQYGDVEVCTHDGEYWEKFPILALSSDNPYNTLNLREFAEMRCPPGFTVEKGFFRPAKTGETYFSNTFNSVKVCSTYTMHKVIVFTKCKSLTVTATAEDVSESLRGAPTGQLYIKEPETGIWKFYEVSLTYNEA